MSRAVDVGQTVAASFNTPTLFGISLFDTRQIYGFDLQAMGYTAPALVQDWGIPRAALGGVFSAGLLGLFLGSILFGSLADRVGRRPVLLLATAGFAACTLLTARAGSLPELLVARALAGLGLGAAMPNATALVGEYSPRRRKVATMMIVTNAFLVGGILGGALSAWLVPRYGWRSVFWVGGLLPLVALPAMFRWLPESLQFLALRGRSPDAAARWLRRVDAAVPSGPGVRYVASEERREGFPVLHLFREGRTLGTALLWAASFMNVLGAYFVSSWLPTLMRGAGHSTRVAVLVGTTMQVGGAIGVVVLGLVQRRAGRWWSPAPSPRSRRRLPVTPSRSSSATMKVTMERLKRGWPMES